MNVFYPAIVKHQSDGSITIRPGAAIVTEELTTKQFAKLVGASQRTVQNWCDEGKIKFRRLFPGSGKILIPASEVGRVKEPPT